jgi:hypothetical protein
MLYLLVGIIIFGLPAISKWYEEKVYIHIMPFGYGLAHIGRVGSVFVTVSVTIERYFAIVHPLKHFRGKRYLLLIPSLLAILYNIPKFFEFELKVRNVLTNYVAAKKKRIIKYFIVFNLTILITYIFIFR